MRGFEKVAASDEVGEGEFLRKPSAAQLTRFSSITQGEGYG
jgi:hypothetical protein